MSEYLMRHGESTANLDGVFAGQGNDAPLTKKGEDQAKSVCPALRTFKITKIISSPLVRALRTAEIISVALGGLDILADDRLAEYDMGALTGKPFIAMDSATLVSAEGAEDPVSFRDRVCASLLEHAYDEGNTLFVAHGGVLRAVLAAMQGVDAAKFHDLPLHSNAEIIEVDAGVLRQRLSR